MIILRLPVEPKDTEQFFLALLKVCLAACALLLMLIAANHALRSMITAHSIKVVMVNQDLLFKEKALALAKLNLPDAELKKRLSNFTAAFKEALTKLPGRYVVVNATALMRTDNVTDVTPQISTSLKEREPS